MSEDTKSRSTSYRWWYLVLVIPFIATLFPQLYNSLTPALGGIPFFYWYQLLWVVLTGILTLIVYAVTKAKGH